LVYVGGDATPWPTVQIAGAASISVGGGRALKARLPKRVAVELRVVNPDGGEATVTFTR
jgi:FAD/FMN-containing dehydrogenase